MLQPRGVIAHDVVRSWDVVGRVAVAVCPLVVTGDHAEVGSRTSRGHRSLADPGDSRGVVAEVAEGSVASVMGAAHDIHLSLQGSLFEVAVGDGAGGVVGRDESILDVLREGVPPDVALASGVEVDTTHAHPSGVRGTQECRLLGDHFSQVCRA